MDTLYNSVEQKLNKKNEEEFKAEVKISLSEINQVMKTMNDKVEELDEIQSAFEEKTETNFRIAEKALLANRDYINSIDARLVKFFLIFIIYFERLWRK